MKKLIHTAFVCLFYLGSLAQTNSRIVFFRMDANLGAKSSALGEYRAYTDAILRNDTEIGKIRSASVFIYDAPDVAGRYMLIPAVNKNKSMQQRIAIYPSHHSITFVKLRLSPDVPIVSYAEVVDHEEFEEYYNETKWLRKKLAEVGYDSIVQLSRGYTTDTKETTLRIRPRKYFRHLTATSQTDTAFYDEYKKITSPDSAAYYCIIQLSKEQYYDMQMYTMDSSQLVETGHYSYIDSILKEGLFLKYYKSGALLSKGEYHNDKENGIWEYYYDTSKTIVSYRCNYVDGHRDGELTSYYPDGKLKRKEFHKYLGNSRTLNNYQEDTVISGICYDKNGQEITFTPFEVFPEPTYDLSKYLTNNLWYPRKARRNGTEGRVVIKFVVDAKGKIRGVKVVKHVSPEIDEEARRVVAEMPNWKPGIQDDMPVDVYFTLPIVFKLE